MSRQRTVRAWGTAALVACLLAPAARAAKDPPAAPLELRRTTSLVAVRGNAEAAEYVLTGASGIWLDVCAGHGTVYIVEDLRRHGKRALLYRLDANDPLKFRTTPLPHQYIRSSAVSDDFSSPAPVWEGLFENHGILRVEGDSDVVAKQDTGRASDWAAFALGLGSAWLAGPAYPDPRDTFRLSRVSPEGKLLARIQLAEKISLSNGLAIGAGSVWACQFWDGNVERVDPITNTIVARIHFEPPKGQVPTRECPLAVTSKHAWVKGTSGSSLLRIDVKTNQVDATFTLDEPVGGVVADEHRVLALNMDENLVTRLDPETGKVLAVVRIPEAWCEKAALSDGVLWLIARGAVGEPNHLYRITFPDDDSPPAAPAAAEASPAGPAGILTRGDVKVTSLAVPDATTPIPEAAGEGALWALGKEGGLWRGSDLLRLEPDNPLAAETIGHLPSGHWGQLTTGEGYLWLVREPPGEYEIAPVGRSKLLRVTPTSGEVLELAPRGWVEDAVAAYGSLWTTSTFSSDLLRWDARTGQPTATITVGEEKEGQLLAGAGSIWLQKRAGQVVHRIDPATNAIVSSTPIDEPGAPCSRLCLGGMAMAGGRLWVVRPRDGALVRLDASTGAVHDVITPASPVNAIVSEDNLLLVTEASLTCVQRLDPSSGEPLATINFPGRIHPPIPWRGAFWVSSIPDYLSKPALWRIEFPATSGAAVPRGAATPP